MLGRFAVVNPCIIYKTWNLADGKMIKCIKSHTIKKDFVELAKDRKKLIK